MPDISKAAIDEIIDTYSDTVYKVAYSQIKNRSDAEDVFQNVFLKYLKKQPDFINQQHAKAWFIRVTINCCKDIWKSSWNRRTQPLEENLVSDVKEENTLDEFLTKLLPKYRIVIHLFYYEEMSISEISKLLRRKESTVKMQLTRARRMLKVYMESGEENV